jgi:hypothetical protein
MLNVKVGVETISSGTEIGFHTDPSQAFHYREGERLDGCQAFKETVLFIPVLSLKAGRKTGYQAVQTMT